MYLSDTSSSKMIHPAQIHNINNAWFLQQGLELVEGGKQELVETFMTCYDTGAALPEAGSYPSRSLQLVY